MLIYKTFISKDIDLMIRAYKIYVLPILDYASSVYNPHKISDITLFESIQRKFTKKLLWQQHLCYERRLDELQLMSLEKRRLFSDLCLMYKILHGQIPCLSHLFSLKNTRTTRATSKSALFILTFKTDVLKYDFFIRTVSVWNSLPVNLTNCNNVKTRMRFLDDCHFEQFLRGSYKR